MASCLEACAPVLATFPQASCGTPTRPGGIKRFIFVKCNVTFSDITDLAEWATKIAAGDVRASGEILGSKPKGSFTQKRLSSCAPEQITGKVSTINFIDNNTDPTPLTAPTPGAFEDYAFWNSIQENYRSLDLGYITCDGLFYGLIPSKTWTLQIDDTRPDNSDDNANFDGSISYTGIPMVAPIYLDGLDAILE